MVVVVVPNVVVVVEPTVVVVVTVVFVPVGVVVIGDVDEGVVVGGTVGGVLDE